MNQKKSNANEGNLHSLSAFNNISFLKTTVHRFHLYIYTTIKNCPKDGQFVPSKLQFRQVFLIPPHLHIITFSILYCCCVSLYERYQKKRITNYRHSGRNKYKLQMLVNLKTIYRRNSRLLNP